MTCLLVERVLHSEQPGALDKRDLSWQVWKRISFATDCHVSLQFCGSEKVILSAHSSKIVFVPSIAEFYVDVH